MHASTQTQRSQINIFLKKILSPEVPVEILSIIKFIIMIIITIIIILTANIYQVLTLSQAPCSAFTSIISFSFLGILGNGYYYYPHFTDAQTEAPRGYMTFAQGHTTSK